jgi:hypothetical protein
MTHAQALDAFVTDTEVMVVNVSAFWSGLTGKIIAINKDRYIVRATCGDVEVACHQLIVSTASAALKLALDGWTSVEEIIADREQAPAPQPAMCHECGGTKFVVLLTTRRPCSKCGDA